MGFAEGLKQQLGGLYAVMLRAFLESDVQLDWPRVDAPRVSIILSIFNRPELTLHCLRSLRAMSIPGEIIIIDNGSTDESALLMNRMNGIRIVRQKETVDFARAAREAASAATGKYLLFVGNTAEVLPGGVESAVRVLESARDLGAVVGKIVLADGRLQEAGGIVLRDGSCRRYGKGDSPWAPAYMYQRDVDYGSRAFLLTHRSIFLGADGFDESHQAAQNEDVDYCIRLWKSGKRVLFDPGAIVVDLELETSLSVAQVPNSPNVSRKFIQEKHAGWIANKRPWDDVSMLEARSVTRPRQRILVLDDRVPHFHHGAGFPRTVELIRTLQESGHFVTFYPVTMPQEDWSEVYDDIPRTVEVMIGWGEARLSEFMEEREGYYDQIIVSRPHNMKTFRSKFRRNGAWTTNARVIYDAEAIFSMREVEHRRMSGEQVTESEVTRFLQEEMSLTEGVHSVFSVSDRERDCFLSAGAGTAWTLGHTVAVTPTPRSFSERKGFLFVGAMSGAPNRDAVLWFCREIWPKIGSQFPGKASFSIVGSAPPDEIRTMPDVNVLGPLSNLTLPYDSARIFVAPSRLAAGIPIKVLTAAANGLPVVCTSILAEELGWQNGVDILVADDPEKFANCCLTLYSDSDLWHRLRANALERVSRECSHKTFAATLAQALSR